MSTSKRALVAEARLAVAEAQLAAVRELALQWGDLLQSEIQIMTTAQANAWRDALLELRAALAAAPEQPTPSRAEGCACGVSSEHGPNEFELDPSSLPVSVTQPERSGPVLRDVPREAATHALADCPCSNCPPVTQQEER